MRPTVLIAADPAAVAEAVAADVAAALTGRNHAWAVLLAGGTTPAAAYRLLAARVPPARLAEVWWLFGDERMVPPDHPDSNYGMVRRSLLADVPVGERVIRVPGELGAEAAADAADAAIAKLVERDRAIDLGLFGIGTDGHTASLFPGSPALGVTGRWFVATLAPDGSARVSATYALLARVDSALFVATGASKAEAVRRTIAEPPGTVPASGVSPRRSLTYYLDVEAARDLPPVVAGHDVRRL